jgi:hypothetical protein
MRSFWGGSYCSKRSTLNVQRTILKIFYGNPGGAGTREALCVTCISELDVERWTLNVGRLEVPYLISITSMSTHLRQAAFG